MIYIYDHIFKTQCAIFVTLTFDLSWWNWFGELTMTPSIYAKGPDTYEVIVISPKQFQLDRRLTLSFINVVNGPIFKMVSQIGMIANIDLGISPRLQEIQNNGCTPFKGQRLPLQNGIKISSQMVKIDGFQHCSGSGSWPLTIQCHTKHMA